MSVPHILPRSASGLHGKPCSPHGPHWFPPAPPSSHTSAPPRLSQFAAHAARTYGATVLPIHGICVDYDPSAVTDLQVVP